MSTRDLLGLVELFNGNPGNIKDRTEKSLIRYVFWLIHTSIMERHPTAIETKDAIVEMTEAHKTAVKTALDISVTGSKVSAAFGSMTDEEIAAVKTALGIS